MSNIKRFYEEYTKHCEKKKTSSNSNRVLGKEENIQTNKSIKSFQKENIHNNAIIPFGYEKSNINNKAGHTYLENEKKNLEKKSGCLKKKKLNFPMKNIIAGKKEFYKKNGKSENFILYTENELGLNAFDKKLNSNIFNSEEDYDSDDMIIMEGKYKVQEDLIDAIENIKKNKFKNIYNYQKYYVNEKYNTISLKK